MLCGGFLATLNRGAPAARRSLPESQEQNYCRPQSRRSLLCANTWNGATKGCSYNIISMGKHQHFEAQSNTKDYLRSKGVSDHMIYGPVSDQYWREPLRVVAINMEPYGYETRPCGRLATPSVRSCRGFLGGGCFGARRFFVHIAVPFAGKSNPWITASISKRPARSRASGSGRREHCARLATKAL